MITCGMVTMGYHHRPVTDKLHRKGYRLWYTPSHQRTGIEIKSIHIHICFINNTDLFIAGTWDNCDDIADLSALIFKEQLNGDLRAEKRCI